MSTLYRVDKTCLQALQDWASRSAHLLLTAIKHKEFIYLSPRAIRFFSRNAFQGLRSLQATERLLQSCE